MKDFISNFIRVMPKQGHEEWLKKLSKIETLYYETEYQVLKQGHRLAATTHIDQDNVGEMLERFNKDGLIFTPLRKSALYVGYGHKHKEIKPGEPFYWYGCLTRTYKDAQKFKKADLGTDTGLYDHKTIGLLLGFPECCTEYFIKTYLINYDPIWLGKEGRIVGYPECNQMLRYFGATRITSHFNCSPTCEATRKIGQLWFKIMKKIDKNLAEELYDLLATPLTWSSYHGVVQVETPYFVGLSHSFPLFEKPRIIEWKALRQAQGKAKTVKPKAKAKKRTKRKTKPKSH